MTIIRVSSPAGADYYRVDADEDVIRDDVDELIEDYESLPEEEQDCDQSDYILNGLEERGYDLWMVDVVDI